MSGIFQSHTHLNNLVTYVIQIIQTTSWLFNALILIMILRIHIFKFHILVWVELCQHVCQYFLTSFHICLDWFGSWTRIDYLGDFLIGNLACVSILLTWTNKRCHLYEHHTLVLYISNIIFQNLQARAHHTTLTILLI